MRNLFAAAIIAATLITGTAHAQPLQNGGSACWNKIHSQAQQIAKAGIPFLGITQNCKMLAMLTRDYGRNLLGLPDGAIFAADQLANRDNADANTSAITWRLAGIVNRNAYVVVLSDDNGEFPLAAASDTEAAKIGANAAKENRSADIYHTAN